MPVFRSAIPRLLIKNAGATASMHTKANGRAAFEDVVKKADQKQLQFMQEMIIQVDEDDKVLGPISKKDSHFGSGVLHRAFSVFLFNSANELLIQKRAANKITFPGYWANTCCSHPLYVPHEMEDEHGVKRAAIRKLEQELGIRSDSFAEQHFKHITTILYQAKSDDHWSEYEVDHILLVRADVETNLNPNEVESVEYVPQDQLANLLQDEERKLSPWFRLIASNLLPEWWNRLDVLLDEREARIISKQTIHRFI